MAALSLGYNFTSSEFLRQFRPEVGLLNNTLPRFLVTTLPFLGVGLWMRRSRLPVRMRILAWILATAAVFHATAWIHVWPIAWKESVAVILWVQPANVYIYAFIFAGLAPPTALLLPGMALFFGVFVAPVLWLVHHSGNQTLFEHVLNDTAVALIGSVLLSRMVDTLRRRVLTLEAEKEIEARKFLGPVLAKAIYSDEASLLRTIRCQGYIASIDVRDSTLLQQQHGEAWLRFRKEYFELVGRIAARHEGYVQKTVGDCHVINFGVMDSGEDLSDIPGIESAVERAEETRIRRSASQVFEFFGALFEEFEQLAERHFPGLEISLGAGVDRGWVERGIQVRGDQAFELDVNGDPVNCASRLQEYSKLVKEKEQWRGSVLVISPYAADYLDETAVCVRIETQSAQVRNYPGIRWVLVRRHAKPARNHAAA